MKTKKYIAIALCLSIVASSFSGVYISYAENEVVGNEVYENEISESENLGMIDNQINEASDTYVSELEPEVNTQVGPSENYIENQNTNTNNPEVIENGVAEVRLFENEIPESDSFDLNDAQTNKAPDPYVFKLEPEVNTDQIGPCESYIEDKNTSTDSLLNKKLSKSGSMKSNSANNSVKVDSDIANGNAKAVYHISIDEMQKLQEEGLSTQDITDADKLANEIGEDPIKLLDIKKETNKSFEEIREDILKDIKENTLNILKVKYEKEYKKLQKAKFSQDEIVALLGYIDINGLSLTDELIKEYQKVGAKLFEKKISLTVSDNLKKKYEISDNDASLLNDQLIQKFEELSKETKVQVKDIIKSYIYSNKK